MKVVFESGEYPVLQIRPESPLEDYVLRKWYGDWAVGAAKLQVSWKNEDGFEVKDVEPK